VSGTAPALVRTWAVGSYQVTLSVPMPRAGQTLSCVMEWTPELPEHLTDAEVEQYRAGRDRAIREIAEQLGVRAAVLEF
jgi:hypothetical protein